VEEVAQRLRRDGLKARTVTLKLRFGDFRTITRSKTLDEATNITKTLWQAAKAIFQKWQSNSAGALRLIGFAASGLTGEDVSQQQLFPDPIEEKQKRLDKAFDEIRNRYGKDAVRHGH
jgi:DNA polymerase-4